MDVTGKSSMENIAKNIRNNIILADLPNNNKKEFDYDAFFLELQNFNTQSEKIKKSEMRIKLILELFTKKSIYPEPSKELKSKLRALENCNLINSQDMINIVLKSMENQSIYYKKIMISYV